VVQREPPGEQKLSRNQRRRRNKKLNSGKASTAPPKTSRTPMSTSPPKSTSTPKNVNVLHSPTKKSDRELLEGPRLTVGDPHYQRQTKLLVMRGRGLDPLHENRSGGLTGIWTSLTSAFSTSGWWGTVSSESKSEEEEDEDDDEEEGHELAKGEGGGWMAEAEHGEAEQEDEEESFQKKMLEELTPKVVEIDILKGTKAMKDTRVGDVKMSGSLNQTNDEIKGSVKGSLEGKLGKGGGSASMLRNADGLEGQGKVELELGGGTKSESNTMKYDIFDSGQALEGSGVFEAFAGFKAGGEGKASYSHESGDFEGKGKAEYFLGTEATGTVTVKLTTGGKSLGSVEGKAAVGYGLGGSIHGSISWKGGTLSFGSGGKVYAGFGGSWSYKVEVSTAALAEVAPNFLSYLWSQMPSVDEWNEEDLWF